MKDVVFQSANQVVTGLIKELRRDGLDTTKNKTAIEAEDVELMYSSGVLSNKTPQSLQYKVFFELSLNFGRRWKEGLRELEKSSFVVVVEAGGGGGGGGVNMSNKLSMKKNHQGVSMKEKEKSAVMYEKCEKPDLCPVKSFDLYFSKLNPLCDSLFQRPTSMPMWKMQALPLSTPPTGLGSLFAGATLGSNCIININFNAGHYTAAVSNNEVWINVLHLSWTSICAMYVDYLSKIFFFFFCFFLQIPSGHMTQW